MGSPDLTILQTHTASDDEGHKLGSGVDRDRPDRHITSWQFIGDNSLSFTITWKRGKDTVTYSTQTCTYLH